MSSDETIYPLILNSSSLVPSTNNNVYRYTFPVGSVKFSNSKVAISNINIYYSWFNITSTYGNNSFQIRWPIGAGTSTYTVTIPNGFYDIPALNGYIQQFCISNGLYLINTSGDHVYYLELITNANAYAVQLNTFSLPTSLPVGWTAPGSWPGYPATAYTPQLIVQSNAFRNIIGFNAATYPAAQQTTSYSANSSFTPQVTPIQSVVVASTLLNNRYSNPGTILYSFSPAGAQFGSVISAQPNEYSFVDIQDGNYPYFDIIFYDQNFNALPINDTNLIIQLLIKSGHGGSTSY
jgi:hypothetical protein